MCEEEEFRDDYYNRGVTDPQDDDNYSLACGDMSLLVCCGKSW